MKYTIDRIDFGWFGAMATQDPKTLHGKGSLDFSELLGWQTASRSQAAILQWLVAPS